MPAASIAAPSMISAETPSSPCAYSASARRRQHVRRAVLEVAGAVGRGGDGVGLRGGGADVVVGREDQRVQAAGLVVGALELAVAVGGQQRALDERADVRVGDVVRDLPAQRLRPELLRARDDRGGGDPRPLGIERGTGAEPGDDVALALGVRDRELAQRPLGLAGVDQRLQDAAVVVGDPLVLEDADDDRVGARGRRCVRGR